MSGKADRSSQRIGCVVGTRNGLKRQKLTHHVLHLVFVSRARSHDGKLYLAGRKLPHLKISLGACNQCSPARLTRGERALGVRAEPYRFHACARWLETGDNRAHLAMYLHEAMRQRHILRSGDAAVRDAGKTRPALRHDSPAGVGQTGIDTENRSLHLRHLTLSHHACAATRPQAHRYIVQTYVRSYPITKRNEPRENIKLDSTKRTTRRTSSHPRRSSVSARSNLDLENKKAAADALIAAALIVCCVRYSSSAAAISSVMSIAW